MLSKHAMAILEFLGDRLEKTKRFDRSGNANYERKRYDIYEYIGHTIEDMDEATANQALSELQGQGLIYWEGRSVEITPPGFEYYQEHKDDHKPTGFVPV